MKQITKIAMELEELGNKLVKCNLNCEDTYSDPNKGVIPRGLIYEHRTGNQKVIVVGLNPGKCRKKEQDYYLDNGISFQSIQNHFFGSNLHRRPYFARIRNLIDFLDFHGDILWTDLAKCQCAGKNGVLSIQTLRVCIDRFLRREVDLFNADIMFTLGNRAFDFCALSFPKHFVIGLPHPTGSYGNFFKLTKRIDLFPDLYRAELGKRYLHGNVRAVHLARINTRLNEQS